MGASVGGSRLPSPAASTPGSLPTSASSRSTNPADAPSSAKRESPSISLAVSTREESKPPSSASSASMLRARSPAPARSTTAVDTCATTSVARRRRAVGVAAGPATPEGPSRWPRGIPAVDAMPQATAATSHDDDDAASSIGSSNRISAARGSTAAALVANRRTATQARKEPAARPAAATTSPSANVPQYRRRRPTPRASRTANSRRRASRPAHEQRHRVRAGGQEHQHRRREGRRQGRPDGIEEHRLERRHGRAPVVAVHVADDPGRVVAGLLDGGAGRQPSDHVERGSDRRGRRQGDPDVDGRRRERERGGHHAGDGVRRVADGDPEADDRRRSSAQGGGEPRADDGARVAGGKRRRDAGGGRHAEHVEEALGDRRDPGDARGTGAADAALARLVSGQLGEPQALGPLPEPVAAEPAGGFVFVVQRGDGHQPVGVGVGQRPPQYAVGHGERRRVQADAERERRHGERHDARPASQPPHHVPQVVHPAGHGTPPPLRELLAGRPRRSSKRRHRAGGSGPSGGAGRTGRSPRSRRKRRYSAGRRTHWTPATTTAAFRPRFSPAVPAFETWWLRNSTTRPGPRLGTVRRPRP